MLTRSTVPESARATLRIIDDALEYLATNDMAHFIKHEKKLRERQRTPYLGFVREVIDRFCLCLKEKRGVMVSDEVAVLGRRRVDVVLRFADCPAFIEYGMYFYELHTKYGGDCKKLRDVLDRQRAAIGVLIHFHFYEDWDARVHSYFRRLSDTELRDGYWRDFRVVPDGGASRKHFVRLAFGKEKKRNAAAHHGPHAAGR